MAYGKVRSLWSGRISGVNDEYTPSLQRGQLRKCNFLSPFTISVNQLLTIVRYFTRTLQFDGSGDAHRIAFCFAHLIMSGHGLGSTEASTSVTINAPGAAKDTTPEHTQSNGAEINQSHAKPSVNGPNARGIPAFSPATTEILKRVSANSLAAATNGTPGWEAAREQVLKSMVTSDKFPTPPPPQSTGKRGGRAGKAVSPFGNGGAMEAATPETSLVQDTQTEQSTPVTGTGRGRGGGRPRGSGRGRGRGGGRGGKRKRDEDDVIKAEDDSEDSESYTPFATMTKSGRAVTKPTTFTPQVPSPASGVKRKRPMNRKNPELAVCNVCLRPHSPASNMIVFCDGCNTPYHRYCHHPPIEQEVVDVPDMEWFCAECRIDRAPSASEVDIDTFVSAQGASESQVRTPPIRRTVKC